MPKEILQYPEMMRGEGGGGGGGIRDACDRIALKAIRARRYNGVNLREKWLKRWAKGVYIVHRMHVASEDPREISFILVEI